MRSWHLARSQTTCGRCGASILKDAPVQLISQIGLTRVLRRCQVCAEGVADEFTVEELAPVRFVEPLIGAPVQKPAHVVTAATGTMIAPKVYEWTSAGELARALERRR